VRARAACVLGWLACFTVAIFAVVAVFREIGLRLNVSPSLPLGLYVARSLEQFAIPGRNTLVLVCLPRELAAFGRARGYLPHGRCADGSAPVGKPVFAIPGDTVVVTPLGITRDNAVAPNTRALRRDSNGQPLVRVLIGRYAVPPGFLWLVSSYSDRSWDSRYYGPVPLSAVVGTLAPWHR